jgi:adenylate kinase family enzyme
MIVVLGMAGAGKSTLCKKLIAGGDYQWFALGEVLRARETGSALAEMAHGGVLSNDLVTPIVATELSKMGDSPEVLLDGCPRTVEQAKWLAIGAETPTVRLVLHLVVNEIEAEKRLSLRGRADDTVEAMKVRFAGYHRDIRHVLAEFTAQNIPVHEINGTLDELEVYGIAKRILGTI